jgi:hypothetical protein
MSKLQGRIIRQHREVNARGQFLKKSQKLRGRSGRVPDDEVLLSAFDDQEGYELTKLGQQFVSYLFLEREIGR